MTEPNDLDEAMDSRAERLENMNRCPSCLRELKACKCQHRCRTCGVLTNHTTAQHEAQLAAQGDDGP